MKLTRIWLGFFLVLVSSLSAEATLNNSSVKQYESITFFQSSATVDVTTTTNVNIEGSATQNDGGGGQFVYIGDSCNDDDGVTIKDNSSTKHCFRRQFTGPVHLNWYGVADGASSGCYDTQTHLQGCNASNAVQHAFDASATWGDGGVVTDGRSIVLYNAGMEIKANQYFSCNGPPGAARTQTGASPYWTQPNSIVLNPLYTITRDAQSRLSDCTIRPTWYTPAILAGGVLPTTVGDTAVMMRSFAGTATTCGTDTSGSSIDGEACQMDNMFIIGFDTCDNSSQAQRTVLSNLFEECNVNNWVHNNGGGIKLQNIVVKQYIEGGLKSPGGTRIDHASWPITNVELSSTDDVAVTINADANPFATDADYTVLINGLGQKDVVTTTGSPANLKAEIDNIRASTGNSDGAADIDSGNSVTDLGGSGCIPPGTIVERIELDDLGVGTAYTNNTMSCDAPGEDLQFSGASVAPVSANGRWLTGAIDTVNSTHFRVHLVGPSWVGPTDATASWKGTTSVISVLDTTNIIPGQYICSSLATAAPFCSPPSGFTFSSTTLGANITSGYTGSVSVGSTTNWPKSGLVKIGSEYLAYTLIDGRDINITARGADGTTKTTHSSGDPVVAAAPTVVGVVPISNAVIASAAAQSNGSGTVIFANDLAVSGSFLGQLTLNAGYHTWTANNATGTVPSGRLIAMATGDGAHTLTLTKNGFKVQPGMRVQDLDNSAHVSSGATVDTVTGNTVTIRSPGSVGSFSTAERIQFSGCGYPGFYSGTKQPYKGNCASTSFLFGADTEGDLAQGVTCEWLHAFGNQIAIHTLNSPATSCTNYVMSGGGGFGDQLDSDSVSLWLDGDATKMQFTNGRLSGPTTAILSTPSKGNNGGQGDGAGVFNTQTSGNIVASANSNLVLGGLHDLGPGTFVYLDHKMFGTSVTGTVLPSRTVYYDDTSVLNAGKLFCANNDFATQTCGDTVNGVLNIGANPALGLGTGPTLQAQLDLLAPILTVTATGMDILGTSGTGPVTIGSSSSWPSTGVLLADSELMTFNKISDTSLDIASRAQRGTVAATHGSSVTVKYLRLLIGSATNALPQLAVSSLGAIGVQAVPTDPLSIGSTATNGECLYNTVDQTTNYERACLKWASNALNIGTEKGGTGTARDVTVNANSGKINLQNNGTTKFTVGTNLDGPSNGARLTSTNASSTVATLVPNRAAITSTGMGADAAGDASIIIGANEDVRFDWAHHTTFKGGATATTASSNGTAATLVGNDVVGRITLGTAPNTQVALTFANSWSNAPICFAQDETTYAKNPLIATASATAAVTFTAAAAMVMGDSISYRCVGYR
jgi:hypothetical protein